MHKQSYLTNHVMFLKPNKQTCNHGKTNAYHASQYKQHRASQNQQLLLLISIFLELHKQMMTHIKITQQQKHKPSMHDRLEARRVLCMWLPWLLTFNDKSPLDNIDTVARLSSSALSRSRILSAWASIWSLSTLTCSVRCSFSLSSRSAWLSEPLDRGMLLVLVLP